MFYCRPTDLLFSNLHISEPASRNGVMQSNIYNNITIIIIIIL